MPSAARARPVWWTSSRCRLRPRSPGRVLLVCAARGRPAETRTGRTARWPAWTTTRSRPRTRAPAGRRRSTVVPRDDGDALASLAERTDLERSLRHAVPRPRDHGDDECDRAPVTRQVRDSGCRPRYLMRRASWPARSSGSNASRWRCIPPTWVAASAGERWCRLRPRSAGDCKTLRPAGPARLAARGRYAFRLFSQRHAPPAECAAGRRRPHRGLAPSPGRTDHQPAPDGRRPGDGRAGVVERQARLTCSPTGWSRCRSRYSGPGRPATAPDAAVRDSERAGRDGVLADRSCASESGAPWATRTTPSWSRVLSTNWHVQAGVRPGRVPPPPPRRPAAPAGGAREAGGRVRLGTDGSRAASRASHCIPASVPSAATLPRSACATIDISGPPGYLRDRLRHADQSGR